MTTINVRVSRVSEPDRGGRAYAWGQDEATGEDVFFAGDWRPMAALAEAVGDHSSELNASLVSVSIETWQVIGSGPGFGFEPGLTESERRLLDGNR